MTTIDINQAYQLLKNLSGMESSFMDYSSSAKEFSNQAVYISYLNSSMIQNGNLWKFYLQVPLTTPSRAPVPLQVTHEGTGQSGLGFSVHKLFNFPEGPIHSCDYYTLLYTMEGCCHLTVGPEVHTLGNGVLCLIPPGVQYAVACDEGSICLAFDLQESFVSANYEDIFEYDQRLIRFYHAVITVPDQTAYLMLRTDNNDSIRNMALHIVVEYINGERYRASALRRYLGLLFTMILRSDQTAITTPVKTSLMEQRYQEIEDYIRTHYQSANLDQVADAVHFSKQYICRIVKAATGDTFNVLLLRLRLEMARHYLLNTDLVMESISEMCGFSSAAYMSKVFKEQYGESPSKYRKMIR